MKNEKPKHFIVLKILGLFLILGGITMIVLGVAVFRTPFGDGTMGNPALFAPGAAMCVISIPTLFVGFAPEINKMQIKTVKYMQQENKEDLEDIASEGADIAGEAVTKITKSIKEGINDTIYCKHCGKVVDADSKFCKHCGKEQ